jgi:cation diffusion facilitator family transporter
MSEHRRGENDHDDDGHDHDGHVHGHGERSDGEHGRAELDHDLGDHGHDDRDQAEHGHGDHGHDDHDQAEHGHGDHGHDDHDQAEHGHGEHGGHEHSHGHGAWGRLSELFVPHSHDAGDKVDAALEGSREGMRAVWLSLAGLGVTAVAQAVVVAISGSVALLGDTLHNLADALTAVPLGVAFVLGRRAATRRYTYGYGRAEDLAGILIVGFIAASAALAGYAAVARLMNPAEVSHLGAVAIAGVIGFLGNELVAQYRIRVGRRIGSAALVTDGLHARTDGFTSLGVLLSAGGLALGWGWADPVVGLAITAAILIVLFGAARQVYRRLMDAVDPELVDRVEETLRSTDGVLDVGAVHVRWIGHQLRAECEIVVHSTLTIVEAHAIAVNCEHRLIHAVPRLTVAFVHADPQPHAGADHHESVAHHRQQPARG